jgi:hypothetical protein
MPCCNSNLLNYDDVDVEVINGAISCWREDSRQRATLHTQFEYQFLSDEVQVAVSKEIQNLPPVFFAAPPGRPTTTTSGAQLFHSKSSISIEGILLLFIRKVRLVHEF